mmetsp:Transcript_182/g.468  ORF Transcript_182/g.468 Transcript_182/m.468 type:complete len:223 (+) Transcript_182:1495-2163(+)
MIVRTIVVPQSIASSQTTVLHLTQQIFGRLGLAAIGQSEYEGVERDRIWPHQRPPSASGNVVQRHVFHPTKEPPGIFGRLPIRRAGMTGVGVHHAVVADGVGGDLVVSLGVQGFDAKQQLLGARGRAALAGLAEVVEIHVERDDGIAALGDGLFPRVGLETDATHRHALPPVSLLTTSLAVSTTGLRRVDAVGDGIGQHAAISSRPVGGGTTTTGTSRVRRR